MARLLVSSFDLQLYPAQMVGAAALAHAYPDVLIILNHAGMPVDRDEGRPRVQFPASRRKTLFGETPNTTRGDAYAPRTCRNCGLSARFSETFSESLWARKKDALSRAVDRLIHLRHGLGATSVRAVSSDIPTTEQDCG